MQLYFVGIWFGALVLAQSGALALAPRAAPDSAPPPGLSPALGALVRVPDLDGDGNADNICRNGFFPTSPQFRIARVAPADGSSARILDDDGDCPMSGDCDPVPLPRGAELIAAARYRDWTCVWHFPDDPDAPELVGWIATADLRAVPAPAPALASWLGTWTTGEDTIHVARAAWGLRATGSAIWRGHGDNFHEGAFAATGTPAGARLQLGDDEGTMCEVELHRVGRYLIAHDNQQCGGANVTFDGVYCASHQATSARVNAR